MTQFIDKSAVAADLAQEDKELLLIDLCARLPYGTIVHIRYDKGAPAYGKLVPLDIKWFQESKIKLILPYLRPMSSMTEEENNERKQLGILCAINSNHERIFDGFGNESADTQLKALDWLNSHHFDYRNLIEKGLALQAPIDMYNKLEA